LLLSLPSLVIPAKAGIQFFVTLRKQLDSGFRKHLFAWLGLVRAGEARPVILRNSWRLAMYPLRFILTATLADFLGQLRRNVSADEQLILRYAVKTFPESVHGFLLSI
jgi:hypothetical protein